MSKACLFVFGIGFYFAAYLALLNARMTRKCTQALSGEVVSYKRDVTSDSYDDYYAVIAYTYEGKDYKKTLYRKYSMGMERMRKEFPL